MAGKDLTREAIIKEIPGAERLYLIGQAIYDDENGAEIRKLVREHDIPALSAFNSIDVMQDILQVYVVKDNRGRYYLVALVDPFELYMNPYIIELAEDLFIGSRAEP